MSRPSSDVQVRIARAGDGDQLARLDAVAWSPQSGFPSVIAAAAGAFFTAANPPEAHLVAEMGGEVAGYIRLVPATGLPENAHVMEVTGIAVDPALRRRGVGSALLTAAERHLRGRGVRKLRLRVLSTNEPAIRLYERLGFQREGVLRGEFVINGAEVDDVLMAKQFGTG